MVRVWTEIREQTGAAAVWPRTRGSSRWCSSSGLSSEEFPRKPSAFSEAATPTGRSSWAWSSAPRSWGSRCRCGLGGQTDRRAPETAPKCRSVRHHGSGKRRWRRDSRRATRPTGSEPHLDGCHTLVVSLGDSPARTSASCRQRRHRPCYPACRVFLGVVRQGLSLRLTNRCAVWCGSRARHPAVGALSKGARAAS